MELDQLEDFKSTPEINKKLAAYGITKSFKEGDIILDEHSFISSVFFIWANSA
jgi:hypothetical protein